MNATQISTHRKAAGLTQDELAEKTGLTVRTIQRIESNATIPRAYTLRKIAEALGVSVQELTTTVAGPQSEQLPGTGDLQLLNLYSFAYLFIPFVHVLVPYQVWKKNKTETGRKILTTQIIWTIALHGSMLLALAFNLAMFHFFHRTAYFISYFWLALAMYIANAVIIVRTHVWLKSGKCRG